MSKIVVAALIAASSIPVFAAAPGKENRFDRFDAGDLLVMNPRGEVLYTRRYPTMYACMRAKHTVEAQNPSPKFQHPPGQPPPGQAYVIASTATAAVRATCIPN